MITLERHTVSLTIFSCVMYVTVYAKTGGNTVLQNISACLPNYMASHFRSQSPSVSLKHVCQCSAHRNKPLKWQQNCS